MCNGQQYENNIRLTMRNSLRLENVRKKLWGKVNNWNKKRLSKYDVETDMQLRQSQENNPPVKKNNIKQQETIVE